MKYIVDSDDLSKFVADCLVETQVDPTNAPRLVEDFLTDKGRQLGDFGQSEDGVEDYVRASQQHQRKRCQHSWVPAVSDNPAHAKDYCSKCGMVR